MQRFAYPQLLCGYCRLGGDCHQHHKQPLSCIACCSWKERKPAAFMGKKQGGQTLLLTPAALVLLVFMVLPMLWVGLMSFLEPDPYGGVCWGQWTFDAYIRFIMDRDLDEQWVLSTD